LSMFNCLLDLPSDAYVQEWPSSVVHVPPELGSDSDKWRAVVHLDNGALRVGPQRSLKAGEVNVFLVDHPSRLSRMDLVSDDPPPVSLYNMGFVHVVEVVGFAATSQSQQYDMSVQSFGAHACADTLQCVMGVAQELVERFGWQGTAFASAGPASAAVGPDTLEAFEPSDYSREDAQPVVIEDYIQTEDRDWTASEGDGCVTVCLLDPSVFPEHKLQEMCLQDQAARKAAQEPEPRVLHQDGSAAVWLVDPSNVQVVHDHFVRENAQPPPAQFTFRCEMARMSMHEGTDFTALRKASHVTLQLKQSMLTLQERLTICVQDFSVVDGVSSSVFSHVLSYFEDERHRTRPSHSNMLCLRVETVPGPGYKVDVRLLPLRLTVDQDVVNFLEHFMQLCTLPYVEETPDTVERTPGAESFAEHFPPRPPVSEGSSSQAALPQLEISIGALLLAVDYRAKRLDVNALRKGDLWELVNLLPLLEGLEIAFQSVSASGGPGQVLTDLVNSWSADLNRTQVLRSLTGVMPIRSFVNVGSGLSEMVSEPLRQYKAGLGPQRVSRAILRGLVSFLRHVTVESIDLTERFIVGTQAALEYATDCLSDTDSSAGTAAASAVPETDAAQWTAVERGMPDFLQPLGAADGLEQAYARLTRGVYHASEAVLLRPMLEFQRGAPRKDVLRTVVSGIPVCMLKPAIGVSAAASTTLRGVRNSVDPVHKREVERKYKGPR